VASPTGPSLFKRPVLRDKGKAGNKFKRVEGEEKNALYTGASNFSGKRALGTSQCSEKSHPTRKGEFISPLDAHPYYPDKTMKRSQKKNLLRLKG